MFYHDQSTTLAAVDAGRAGAVAVAERRDWPDADLACASCSRCNKSNDAGCPLPRAASRAACCASSSSCPTTNRGCCVVGKRGYAPFGVRPPLAPLGAVG